MPNRVIKESLWTSPNLNKLSDLAERHFYRILCLPDDFGCCELTPLVVKGRCYPLKEKITTKQIEGWNRELEAEDILRIWNDNGRYYAYFPTFNIHQRVRSKHLRKTPEPPESVTCRQVSAGDGDCHPNHNPNHNHNHNHNPVSDDTEFVLPEWMPKETWDAYLEVRNKKRATKTVYALNLIIKELLKIKAEYNQNPLDVLNKSIKSGWIDVFPLKENQQLRPIKEKSVQELIS